MRLQAILALLCALTAAAAYHFTPHLMLADLQPIKLETMIPEQFGEWRMVPVSGEIISSPEQEAVIKSIYSQVLTRTYIDNAGNHIMLSIAYTRDQSDNSGTQSHKPEICYPAQGFSIKSNRLESIKTDYGILRVRQLLTQNVGRTEPLIYWTMIGEKVATSSVDVKLSQLSYGFNNIIPDGLIFRVSSITNDVASGYVNQQHFINSLLNHLPEHTRAKLSGFTLRK